MRRHPTHTADEARGIVSFGKFQLEGNTFAVLGYGVIAGLIIWTVLVLFTGINVYASLALAALPFIVSLIYIVLFTHNKPPAFAHDLFQLLFEGNATWFAPNAQPNHPNRKEISSEGA